MTNSSEQSKAAPKPSRIGEILVEEKVVTEDQLKRALKVQAAMEQGRQLSEIFVELGYATKKAISAAIAKHGKSLRIGDMLVEQGIITEEDVDKAIGIQKEKSIPFGEVLLELGLINERILLINLAHQGQVPFIEPSFGMIDKSVLVGVSPDFLAKNQFMPFAKDDDGRTVVVVSNLHDFKVKQSIDDIYHGDFTLALGPSESLKQCIEDYRRFGTKTDSPRHAETEAEEDENSIIPLVEHLLIQAIEDRASDVHIEPKMLSNAHDARMGAGADSLAGQVLAHIPHALESLPVLPAISQKVLKLVDDPDSSMSEFADLIREDTVMAAKVLTVSNSALYGGLSQITDLSNACARLGMRTVASIVQTVANENLYKVDNPEAQKLMEKLWHHAVATAYLSHEIALLLSVPNAGIYHLAGLIHDIGKIALVDIIYSAEDGSLAELKDKPEIVHEIMSNYHALIGLHIVQDWNLPPDFAIAAYCHHNPDDALHDEWKSIAHTVALANSMAHVSDWGSDYDQDVALITHPSAVYFSFTDIKLATMRVDLDEKMESLLGALASN